MNNQTNILSKHQNDADQFDAIKAKYKLNSVFLVEGVEATDLNQKVATVKKIIFESYQRIQEITFKELKEMSWLELWIEADHLICMSDLPFINFIDVFEEDKLNPGHYHLYTIS